MEQVKSIWSSILTDVKNKRFDLVEEEIRQIHEACQGRILKVIVEILFINNRRTD